MVAEYELRYKKKPDNLTDLPIITSSEYAYNILKPLYDLELIADQEYVNVLYLNRANAVMGAHLVHIGGINACMVDVRIIMRSALLCGATGIIICHNHPTGSVKPSENDRRITKQLKECGVICDIKLLDHLIIGENTYYSFADQGDL